MRNLPVLILLFLTIFCQACQSSEPVCPPDRIKYVPDLDALHFQNTSDNASYPPPPTEIEIKGKLLAMDRIVQGPLCSDTWSGVGYVACDLQIIEWEEDPTFLKDCDLNIEPGTVVYVASHNNEPYYKGCSCHTGDVPGQ